MPGPGGYWLTPARIAAIAASAISVGAVGVGEALPEVDGAGLDGERRHLGENGRTEAVESPGEVVGPH